MASDPRRDALIAAARARLDIPYALPPSPPATTDCSYWIGDVCAAAGFPIKDWLHPTRTAEQIRAVLVPIDFADVLPGDILTFEHTYDDSEPSAVGDGHVATHIGMSLGAGTHNMLNAVEPSSRETNIGTAYWQDKLLSAGRLPQLEASVPSTDLPRGIDVSNNQGSINWAAVGTAGLAFAWLKATEGVGFRDAYLPRNMAGAAGADLIRGMYDFGRPDQAGPEDEARFFLDYVEQTAAAVGWQTGDMMGLDLESTNGSLERAAANGVNIAQWALAWLQYVSGAVGYAALLYTTAGVIQQFRLDLVPALNQHGLWLAAWPGRWPAPLPAAPAPWDFIAFWQHADDGSVPGISGDVDLDVFNGPLARLPLYGRPASAPVPPPPPPVDQKAQAVALLKQAIGLLEA